MNALEKLKQLKKNMDYNLSIPSIQILPIINEVIKELESETKETEIKKDIPKQEAITPVVIEPQKTLSNETTPELNKVPVEVKPVENDVAIRAMEYLRNKKCKGLNYRSDDNLIARAVKEWFTV